PASAARVVGPHDSRIVLPGRRLSTASSSAMSPLMTTRSSAGGRVREKTTFVMFVSIAANSRSAAVMAGAAAGALTLATVSHHGTIASYSFLLSAQVSAARTNWFR